MMRKPKRRGFTLPEVLVTLAIVATLAAVLLPALNSQLSKGDAGRVASDLISVQTAIGAFTSDVRRYPASLTQLNSVITTGQSDLQSQTYPTSLVARWRGPYLSKSLVSGAMPTAFGATISGTVGTGTLSGQSYATVTFSPISSSDFDKVDLLIDEAANSTTGQLQYGSTTANSTTATFYIVPIQ